MPLPAVQKDLPEASRSANQQDPARDLGAISSHEKRRRPGKEAGRKWRWRLFLWCFQEKKSTSSKQSPTDGDLWGLWRQDWVKLQPTFSKKLRTAHISGINVGSLRCFPAVSTLLGTSAPTQSLTSPLRNSLKPPPLHSPLPLSSARRRFTVSGAANDDSLPICHRHRRGILVHFWTTFQRITWNVSMRTVCPLTWIVRGYTPESCFS